MTEINSGITEELLLLYELALSVGRSLDVESNCQDFLSILMARKNISYAAVWLRSESLPEVTDDAGLKLVYATPRARSRERRVPLSHPSSMALEGREFHSVSAGDSGYEELIAEHDIESGVIVLFRLGQIGLLKLYSSQHGTFRVREMNQLRGVVEKFAIALEGSLAHARLTKEVAERKRVEQDLQRVYEELEQRVEDRTAALQQSEAALSASHAKLRKLAGDLITAQEAERQSFARELHDDLTQRLAVLPLDVDALVREYSKAPRAMREQLRELQSRIADITSDAQGMARRLHPSILDDLGLVKALKAECVHFSNREGIEVAFEHRDVPANLPRALSLCLYRIAQESLRNIGKHAVSRDAIVGLAGADSEEIRLTVEDHGMGFSPENADGRGLGLVSMRERASLNGGTCWVRSVLGEGTKVDVRLPLEVDMH